ncbi:MAG TPA: glycosyltransferase family 2 protein [Candidatus Cloacimonadota bacterium]|nr:glycosyltransferase family 2 protein [Candidatus Cloacimonadota bacterium]
MLLSFVIPLYNEKDTLEILYREILQNLDGNDYEILFIDDGSNDGSFEVLKRLASSDSKVKVVKLRRNFGKAAGLNTGFQLAQGDVIFTMDADLQDNPVEIPNFLNKLEEGYDLVSGWKKKRLDPLHKRVPSKFFNTVTQKTFKLKLHDYNCGFKAYRKEVVKNIDVYGEMHRYIPALAHAKGFRVGEIPVLHRSREHGVSKYGFERYLRGFFDLLTVKLVTQYIRSPLYFFGGFGTILAFVGFLITLYLSIAKIFYGMPLTNRPLLFLGVLLILAGLQLFSLGLLAELMVHQSRKKTYGDTVSIEKTINFD